MRKFLFGLIALVVLLAGAALVVPSLINWNAWKGDVAARVTEATGRAFVIQGDLDLAVLPSPRLTVQNARLGNLPGAAEPDMATLKSLDIRIRFAPLLSGRVEVESVILEEPVIRLEKLADGRANWVFGVPGEAPSPSPGTTAPLPSSGAAGEAIRLESVRIRNGTLVWHDAAAGTTERIERVNANIAARSLSGPFQLQGGLVARGVPLAIDVSVGRFADQAAVPFSLTAEMLDAGARLDISGTVAGLAETPRFSGRAEAQGPSLARLLSALDAGGASTPPGFLAQPFRFETRLRGSGGAGAADDVEITLGSARVTGGLTFDIGETVKADLELRSAGIDLDRWLAAPPAVSPVPRAAPSGAAPGAAADPRPGTAGETPFALPKGINATVDLRVDAAGWRGQAIRDVSVQAALNEGEVTISQISARLPGEAEASVFGFLTAKDGRPSFEGTVEARADNLRSTLDWAGADVAGVPADRLRKFALSAGLRGDDRQVQLLDAKISLDTSRIDGGVTYALRARPSFGASVNINQLNLDAYLPREAKAPAARPAAPSEPATVPPTALAPGAEISPAPAGPIALLGAFDANLRLNVGSLTFRQTPVQDVRFDGTLAQGRLAVREASVQSLAGTSVALKGELAGFGSVPVFRGSFSADSRNLAGLLRVVGLDEALSARRLGTMRLRGNADGGAENVTFDAALDIAGGKLALEGAAEGLASSPRYKGTLTASHPELTAAIAAFGGADPEPGRTLGPVEASVSFAGDPDAMTAEARLGAAGGALDLRGRVESPLAAPVFEATAAARHPEFRELARAFAPDWRPAAAKLGAFRLDAALKGTPEAATLSELAARIGEMSLSGTGALALTGERPALTAALDGGVIDLNPFLPAPERREAALRPPAPVLVASAAPSAAVAQAQAPFSTEPLDLSALGALDAEVTLGAEALIWRNFRVDRPNAKATLADRLLTVEQVAGRMFDGAFLLKGTLDGRETPALEASVSVEKANVGKALFDAAEFDLAGGIMDFRTTMTARGASQSALVAALDGEGTLSVRDGAVKGFDLRAVSDRLKELDKGLDFLQLLAAGMGGGETRFSSLDGTYRIDKGVLRTDDLRLVAEAGAGAAKGFADLPRWAMDFTGEFSLTEHPGAPPFGMRAVGPIDNPRRVFQLERLQGWLLQRGIGTLLRRAVPERKPEATQEPQPQQPQPAPSPEDLLRGLLDGLRPR